MELDIGEELSALVEWLQLFNLTSEFSPTSALSAGVPLAETLVIIEPSFFTPTWFAGILHSEKCCKQNLDTVLNLMLHYYRQNLDEVTASGSLEIPDLSGEIDQDTISRFLKLMLGIAVTCSNKQTFIGKIQSLDPTIQHTLTQCVASFIIIKDWGDQVTHVDTDTCREGRVSAQSLTSEVKATTPPGDEIWAQKCHELDFQVALLKEERSNLMVENEELYGKVREAQTLSRKDSVKAKQLETEVDHLKDEFDRLRLLYESTRDHMDNIEKRIRPEEKDQVEILKLKGETAAMKAELATLKASHSRRPSEKSGMYDECEVVQRLQDQQQYIQDLRHLLEYQVSIQTSLVREIECLKDQLDLMREQWHNLSDTSGRYEDDGLGVLAPFSGKLTSLHSEAKLTSLRSEACLVSTSHSQSNLLEHSYTVSQNNLALLAASKSAFDVRRSEEGKHKFSSVKVVKKKLTRDPVVSQSLSENTHETQDDDVVGISDGRVSGGRVGNEENESENNQPIYVNNYDYADFYQIQDTVRPARQGSGRSRSKGVYSGESDSGLDVTPETTPYTSRPESELLLGDDKEDRRDDEVEASPRQLEIMMEESRGHVDTRHVDTRPVPCDLSKSVADITHRTVDELIRVISDSNIAISVDEIEALVGAGTNDEDYSQLVEDIPEDKFHLESCKRPCLPIPLDPAEIQLFDPNDPKVRDLEEWNCSINEKSLYEEKLCKSRFKKFFRNKKKNKSDDLKLLTRTESIRKRKENRTCSESSEYSYNFKDENLVLQCFKSWLLSIFVKIFD